MGGLCAYVRSAVGEGLVKGGCVVDVVCVLTKLMPPPLRGSKENTKTKKTIFKNHYFIN